MYFANECSNRLGLKGIESLILGSDTFWLERVLLVCLPVGHDLGGTIGHTVRDTIGGAVGLAIGMSVRLRMPIGSGLLVGGRRARRVDDGEPTLLVVGPCVRARLDGKAEFWCE